MVTKIHGLFFEWGFQKNFMVEPQRLVEFTCQHGDDSARRVPDQDNLSKQGKNRKCKPIMQKHTQQVNMCTFQKGGSTYTSCGTKRLLEMVKSQNMIQRFLRCFLQVVFKPTSSAIFDTTRERKEEIKTKKNFCKINLSSRGLKLHTMEKRRWTKRQTVTVVRESMNAHSFHDFLNC